MMKIYAMSDIHGYLKPFEEKMNLVDLSGDNKLILLGDYIDYGNQSGQVLRYVYDLEQKYGSDKVIVLKGNHEDMLLSWLSECRSLLRRNVKEDYFFEHQWFLADSGSNLNSFESMVTEEQYKQFCKLARKASRLKLNTEAARMIMENNGDIISWMKNLRLFYETDNQIFVHAGIDEEAEEFWKTGSSEEVFLWKYPPVTGLFYRTIIAGHVASGTVAKDKDFHEVFFDGQSHYYIDGTVSVSRRIPLLMVDTAKDKYYQVTEEGKSEIKTGF